MDDVKIALAENVLWRYFHTITVFFWSSNAASMSIRHTFFRSHTFDVSFSLIFWAFIIDRDNRGQEMIKVPQVGFKHETSQHNY